MNAFLQCNFYLRSYSCVEPFCQAGNLEKCRLLMRKMIESGDIAVPELYSGMTQNDSMLNSKIELMSRAGGSSKGIIDGIS